MSADIIDNLSSDRYYAYKISLAVILGEIDFDLAQLEVGPTIHSRYSSLLLAKY